MKGVFWLLVATLVCAGGAFWFVTSSGQDPRPQDDMRADAAAQDGPRAGAPAGAATPETAAAAPRVAQATPANPEPAPPADVPEKPDIIVDSFAAAERMPLESWTLIEDFAGFFDVLIRRRDGIAIEEGVFLEASDILVAQGWAGDRTLGLNLDDVVFSACGHTIGRAQVGGARPDVADAVHPNLAESGWHAEFLAGDLPSCADSEIRAWAVAPGDLARLVPLAGRFAYVSPGVTGTPPRLSAQQTITPDSYPRPEFAALRVTASRANLRTCGSTSCAVVGQIDGGSYNAHIATRGPEWSLIVFPDRAGWLFNGLFEIAR